MSDEFLNFIWLTAKSLLSSAMEKLKLAKGNVIPHLKEDGSNYQEWRSSYVAFYCTQINTVMEIAKQSDLKPETIDMEDAKMMTLTIFECIHQNLRVVYVGQRLTAKRLQAVEDTGASLPHSEPSTNGILKGSWDSSKELVLRTSLWWTTITYDAT